MISHIFGTLGIIIALSGGVIAAYTAKKPMRFWNWTSAYLVLIAGVSQFGLAYGWSGLGLDNLASCLAFVLFNLSNLLMVAGTYRKSKHKNPKLFINSGGILMIISIALLLANIQNTTDTWEVIWFIALAIFLLITMCIGVLLSAFRKSYKNTTK